MGETIQQKSMNSGAEENPAQKRREIRLLLASGVLFALSLLFQLLARLVPGFGEWYAVTVYPFIVGTLGRISGIFPFSVVESAVYFLIAAAVWYTVTHIRRIKRVLVRALFLLTGIFFCLHLTVVSIIIENRSPATPVWKSESLQRTNLQNSVPR